MSKGDRLTCVDSFLEKFSFRDQYGFIKDARLEKIDDFTTLNAVSSVDNDQSEQELNQVNTELAELLRGLELRKRAYYVNMPNTVYVIGGYLFDPIRKERRAPTNDWRWEIDEKKLEKIPSVPGNGRINFGLAANNGKLVVIGGNSILNKAFNSCYLFGQNDERWNDLPTLPNPLCSPSVTFDEKDSLFVLGGYDLLSGRVSFRNDFLQLEDLRSTQWKTLNVNLTNENQTIVPRARALLITANEEIISPDGGLIACGGYHKTEQGDLVPVPEILAYDKTTCLWTLLSTIPNLQKLNILSIDNNVLVISERDKSSDEIIPISTYDLVKKSWLMINGDPNK